MIIINRLGGTPKLHQHLAAQVLYQGGLHYDALQPLAT